MWMYFRLLESGKRVTVKINQCDECYQDILKQLANQNVINISIFYSGTNSVRYPLDLAKGDVDTFNCCCVHRQQVSPDDYIYYYHVYRGYITRVPNSITPSSHAYVGLGTFYLDNDERRRVIKECL